MSDVGDTEGVQAEGAWSMKAKSGREWRRADSKQCVSWCDCGSPPVKHGPPLLCFLRHGPSAGRRARAWKQ